MNEEKKEESGEMLPHLPRIPLEVTLKISTRYTTSSHNVQLDRGARAGLDTFTLPVSVCIYERRRGSPRGGLEREREGTHGSVIAS